MIIRDLEDPALSVQDLLRSADSAGLVLTAEGKPRYAVLPFDEDILDTLLERSPKLIEECRAIWERMRGGQSWSHAEVEKILTSEART